jgi:hypothetical protein
MRNPHRTMHRHLGREIIFHIANEPTLINISTLPQNHDQGIGTRSPQLAVEVVPEQIQPAKLRYMI